MSGDLFTELMRSLRGSFDPDAQVRGAAEQHLYLLETSQLAHLLHSLLSIVVGQDAAGVEPAVRHAAAIRFKNLLHGSWGCGVLKAEHPNRQGAVLPNEERPALRGRIFSAVCSDVPANLQHHLLDSLFAVLRVDFPERWPDIVPLSIQYLMQANSRASLLGVSRTVRLLFKLYKFKKNEARLPVNELAAAFLPHLLKHFDQQLGIIASVIALHQANASLDSENELAVYFAFAICGEVGKALRQCVFRTLPPHLHDISTVHNWVALLMSLFRTSSIQAQCGRSWSSGAARCQKWSARVLSLLFVRFGQPMRVEDSVSHHFAMQFLEGGSALAILGAFLEQLHAYANGYDLPPPVLISTYQFLEAAICHANLYSAMRNHLTLVLFGSVFQTLCVRSEELAQWSSDPHGYLAKRIDLLECADDERMNAARVLTEAVRIRTSDALAICVETIESVLTQYIDHPKNMDSMRKKDGALRMFGYLNGYLNSRGDVRPWIEAIMSTHVLHEFLNDVGFMRTSAAWVTGRFIHVPFSDPTLAPRLIEHVITCLSDPDLPVKFEACNAFASLMKCKPVQEHVRPKVGQVLRDCLELIDEVGNEQVISLLESIILRFGKDAVPHAIDVCRRLMAVFQEHAEQAGDDEGLLLAGCAMRSINVLLYSIDAGNVSILPHLEQLSQPLLELGLSKEGAEFIDDALEMIASYTQSSECISDFMWHLLPQMVEAQQTFAPDILKDLICPLSHYIEHGGDRFFSNSSPDYVRMVLFMCSEVFRRFHIVDECKYANRIIESMLLHGRGGRMDRWIGEIVQIVLERLSRLAVLTTNVNAVESTLHRLLLLHLCGLCAYSNVELFTTACESVHCTDQLWSLWFNSTESMIDTMQRSAALGMSSLLLLPRTGAPVVLQSNYSLALTLILDLLCSIEEDMLEACFEYENAPQRDADHAQGEIPDNEHYPKANARDALSGQGRDGIGYVRASSLHSSDTKSNTASLVEQGVVLFDDEIPEEDIDDDISPVFRINPFIHFVECFEVFANESSICRSVQSSLDKEHSDALTRLLRIGATARGEQQQEFQQRTLQRESTVIQQLQKTT